MWSAFVVCIIGASVFGFIMGGLFAHNHVEQIKSELEYSEEQRLKLEIKLDSLKPTRDKNGRFCKHKKRED